MNCPLVLSVCFIALFFAGCGAKSAPIGEPWNSRDAVYFDDGADLIVDPNALSGAIGREQKDSLEARIQLSDLVAVIEIYSLHTEKNVDKKESKRIEVNSIDTMYGSFPRGSLPLKTASSSPGYELMVRHEAHLAGNFILFYRGFQEIEENKEKIGCHFHLTKASPELIQYIKLRLKARQKEEDKSSHSVSKE
jgi:hypothetical protein